MVFGYFNLILCTVPQRRRWSSQSVNAKVSEVEPPFALTCILRWDTGSTPHCSTPPHPTPALQHFAPSRASATLELALFVLFGPGNGHNRFDHNLFDSLQSKPPCLKAGSWGC